MPTTGYSPYENRAPRIAAWAAHYERKGCHPVKAQAVARRKCSKSHTWPAA